MLNDLKIMLGIAAEDTGWDARLNLILTTAASRLKLLLGGIEPPASMEYMILEVAIRRFNRIGSEGIETHTVEGESLQFSDGDFDAFSREIQSFLDSRADSTQGRMMFI
ncbi:MAG: phage head-tail connector protein [Oscillospiraceae bacterium]